MYKCIACNHSTLEGQKHHTTDSGNGVRQTHIPVVDVCGGGEEEGEMVGEGRGRALSSETVVGEPLGPFLFALVAPVQSDCYTK